MKLERGLRAILSTKSDLSSDVCMTHFSLLTFPKRSLNPPLPIWRHSLYPFPALFFSVALINMSALLRLLECSSMNKEMFWSVLFNAASSAFKTMYETQQVLNRYYWMNENKVPETDLNTEAVKWKALQLGVEPVAYWGSTRGQSGVWQPTSHNLMRSRLTGRIVLHL